ncbi:phosphatidylinositol 4-kinase [Striga asiatica]|uniref:1-phosphatidylinositol 4-kinase n=1 Tax=Striga asiatica TaxID=4170 RepID=A0A5A7R232_STRAF|nr:phosphatidylinositol 4-kinase [Striga asiatica]
MSSSVLIRRSEIPYSRALHNSGEREILGPWWLEGKDYLGFIILPLKDLSCRLLSRPSEKSELSYSVNLRGFEGFYWDREKDRGDSSDLDICPLENWKQTGRRRVFVQTETGCVLGMDLDRSDNAHTVKRRLQLALNFPIEESSLTFGDMILKNDLSAVRKDSPLLLTRNLIHRSSSTPCLSPMGPEAHHEQDGLIEILGHSARFAKTKQIVKKIVKAVKNGVDPVPIHSGLGGAYYFKNLRGENVAIVKPTDEEPFAPNNPKGFVGKALGQPGLKRSVRVGETGFREVAAYLLDYDHFANVPPTALVKITHPIFNVNDGLNNGKNSKKNRVFSKIASFQQFIPHDFDASDYGTSCFPVSDVHRIGILDIRILNTDRHAGNLLVRKVNEEGQFGQFELIPIDHGLCLPETLEDPYFEWIHWPQASIPFSEDELEYIQNLDPARDSDMLKRELPMIRDACLRVLFLCTVFLKEAAANGLCLAEIGEMMSREFKSGEEEPSELEVICLEARRLAAEEILYSTNKVGADFDDDNFHFEIDCCEEDNNNGYDELAPKMVTDESFTSMPFQFGFGSVNGRFTPLSRLEETVEEEEEKEDSEEVEDEERVLTSSRTVVKSRVAISKLSVSLKNTSLVERTQKSGKLYSVAKMTNGYLANSSSGHTSANEQLPASVSFVKLADMSEDEWTLFMEKFQELLGPVFEKRKFVSFGQKQRQRLGTSCKF